MSKLSPKPTEGLLLSDPTNRVSAPMTTIHVCLMASTTNQSHSCAVPTIEWVGLCPNRAYVGNLKYLSSSRLQRNPRNQIQRPKHSTPLVDRNVIFEVTQIFGIAQKQSKYLKTWNFAIARKLNALKSQTSRSTKTLAYWVSCSALTFVVSARGNGYNSQQFKNMW